MSVLPPSVVDALSDEDKRHFLLELERDLIELIANREKSLGPELQVPLDFMPNSYYRLLVHQFCQYYRLRTWTNRAGGISVAADPEIDYETLLEIVDSLSVVLEGMGIIEEQRDNERDTETGVERPSMINKVPENKRSGQIQRSARHKFGRSRQSVGIGRDEYNYSHYGDFHGNFYGHYDLDYGNFGARNWAADFVENLPMNDFEQTQRYVSESGDFRSEVPEDIGGGDQDKESQEIHATDQLQKKSGGTSTNRYYRHVQFSPDAAPFHPSQQPYPQYDSPYYYSQYQGRTERDMLINPYIILPGDTKKRKDLKKRK